MNGEFKIQLKEYKPETITHVFENAYGKKLKEAYAKSEFAQTNDLPINSFYAGYLTNDSLILLYTKESTTMKVYIETTNREDIKLLISTVNEYYQQMVHELKAANVKWTTSQATITIEQSQFTGKIETRWDRIKQIFHKQKEKLFIVPVSGLLISFLIIHYQILGKKEIADRWDKTLILTLETYSGLLLAFLAEWLFAKSKKDFNFKF
jgi:hypothetical protein